jgi:hypothetical protein
MRYIFFVLVLFSFLKNHIPLHGLIITAEGFFEKPCHVNSYRYLNLSTCLCLWPLWSINLAKLDSFHDKKDLIRLCPGSGSGSFQPKKFRIGPDPDPQHCLKIPYRRDSARITLNYQIRPIYWFWQCCGSGSAWIRNILVAAESKSKAGSRFASNSKLRSCVGSKSSFGRP